jgi:hypothetical protein
LIEAVTRKYIEIVEKEVGGEDTDKLWLQCERMEKQIGDNPGSILYSEKAEEEISYRQKVLEIEKDKDDFLYSMAGHKGETVESLGTKTVSDLYSFAERFNSELDGGRTD